MGSFPECADLIRLAARWKGSLLDTQCQETLEMLGLGVTAAGFPPNDCLPGNPQKVGQPLLCQTAGAAQGQRGLTEGIIPFPIRRTPHGYASFSATIKSEAMQTAGKS